MRHHLSILTATGTLLLSTGAARATISYDALLASPNTTAADAIQTSASNSSWFNGKGNPQGGFTINDQNGIELGLRAKLRLSAAAFDSTTDLYTFSTGADTSGRALWNYEFSIDLNPGDGPGGQTFDGVTAASLKVTDANTGITTTLNPLTYAIDNAGYGSAAGTTNSSKDSGQQASDWAAQNSANLKWTGPGFNLWAADTYNIDLSVTYGTVTTTDSIVVSAVPEPGSLIVLGTICLGMLGFVRRRADTGNMRTTLAA